MFKVNFGSLPGIEVVLHTTDVCLLNPEHFWALLGLAIKVDAAIPFPVL